MPTPRVQGLPGRSEGAAALVQLVQGLRQVLGESPAKDPYPELSQPLLLHQGELLYNFSLSFIYRPGGIFFESFS